MEQGSIFLLNPGMKIKTKLYGALILYLRK